MQRSNKVSISLPIAVKMKPKKQHVNCAKEDHSDYIIYELNKKFSLKLVVKSHSFYFFWGDKYLCITSSLQVAG